MARPQSTGRAPDPRAPAFEKEKAEVPVFVDLYVNRVFNHEGISLIMETIADALSATGEINKENIFIHVHEGNPGFIYINEAVSYQLSAIS